MLREPIAGIVADADVERSMTATRENIDIVGSCGVHRRRALPGRLTAVVMGPGLRRDDDWIDWNKLRTL